jgi:thymidine phosphorylase
VQQRFDFPKNFFSRNNFSCRTADVIETIAPVDLTIEEIRKVVNKTGACLAWGGGLGMAPADSKIIQIEKSLQIDPKAQL